MDPKIANILGISKPTPNTPAKLIPAPPAQSKDSINAAYRSLGVPPIARADNELVQAFHARALVIIQEEARAAVQALNQVSDELKPEIRIGRMSGIAQMAAKAMHTRLANAAVPLARVIYDARAIVDAAMDRQPKEANAATLWFLKVADVRRQIEGKNMGEIVKAATLLAERGDETFPAVFLDSLNITLPDGLAVTLTQTYQRACAGDNVDTLEQAEDALQEVKAILNSVKLALSAAFSGKGVPHDWDRIPVGDIVKAWPKAAKASFIASKGEEAYTDLLQGKLGLETALTLFRPGLGEN